MFENVALAPEDPILGLNEAFKADQRSDKVNLTVGVYQDDTGTIPKLKCVAEAEKRMAAETAKLTYLPIDGDPQYARAAAELMLGIADRKLQQQQVVSAQTPGGTGGLRVTADLLSKLDAKTIWHSNPTWANHVGIFNAAGIDTKPYAYLNAAKTALDFGQLIQSVSEIPVGDAILVHGCCHNPTGVDPTNQQWEEWIDVIKERKLFPVVDCAYQGFGSGLDDDAFASRLISQSLPESMIVQSFSKNFSLYNQRVGAVHVLTENADSANAVRSQLKNCIRVNYSNPPQFGAGLVRTVLTTSELRQLWESEVTEMRVRIAQLRKQFSEQLAAKCSQDFSHVSTQCGMFSFSGLTPDQVEKLRSDYGIYIVGNGRMNVAGLSSSNLEKTTDAIAAIVG